MDCHLGVACSLKYSGGGGRNVLLRDYTVYWFLIALCFAWLVQKFYNIICLLQSSLSVYSVFCLWRLLIAGLLILILRLTTYLSLQSKFEPSPFHATFIISHFWLAQFCFKSLVLWNLYKCCILLVESNIGSILVHYLSFLLFPGKAPPGATEHVISGVWWRGRVTSLEEHCGFEFSGDNGSVCVSADFNGACCSDTS